ncbi:MAG: response regulator [Bacteroidetes bacterium]|nr:response regulator [Bacteroidota bacterium]
MGPNLNSQSVNVDSLQKALASQPDNKDKVEASIQIAEQIEAANPALARKILQDVIKLSESLDYPQGKGMAIRMITEYFMRDDRFTESLEWGNIGLEFCQIHQLTQNEAMIRSSMASAYQQLYEYDKALLNNHRSLKLLASQNVPLQRADIYHNLGDIHFHLSNYDSSLYYLFEAIRLRKKAGDLNKATPTLFMVANVYSHQGDHGLALDYINQAFEALDTLRNIRAYSGASTVKGMIFQRMHRYDSAHYYGSRAYKINQTYDLQRPTMFNCWLMGVNAKARGDTTGAYAYFRQGLEVAKELDYLGQLAIHSTQLGWLEFGTGNIASAKQLALNGYEYAREARTTREMVWSTELLYKIYDRLGETQKAYDLYKEHIIFKDSLAGKEKNFHLLELEKQYRTAEQQKKIAQNEVYILQEKASRQRLLNISLIVIGLLIGIFLINRYRMRIQKQQAEAEAQKLKEINELKSAFFANISHEFRTPLSLILSPVEQLIDQKSNQNPDRYLQMIRRNGQRLLQLVNQLLDLSKLESGKLQLHPKPLDLNAFARAITQSFESLAVRKSIQYRTHIPSFPLVTTADGDILEKILSNLLSNAFKFTPEEGIIRCAISTTPDEKNILIKVEDSGPGIAPEKREAIFERYFSESGNHIPGTGIGLALTKELVLLHGGSISVQNGIDGGAGFHVQIPLETPKTTETTISSWDPKSNRHATETAPTDNTSQNASESKLPILLLVEDNRDMQQFIIGHFSKDYEVHTADDGKEGLEMAKILTPDLIITDLLMPKVDGLELTEALRQDTATSHIPVVMLTGKSEKADRIAGIKTGVDAYVSKPFSTEELESLLENLQDKQARLREQFGQVTQFRASAVNPESVDEVFLHKVLEKIEDHIDDEYFGVTELAETLSLSRSQLHRKLKALSGKTPNAVIREIRLDRAKELLEKGAGNASEVAFMVGFSSSSYFSKCFKEAFGKPPSEFMGRE